MDSLDNCNITDEYEAPYSISGDVLTFTHKGETTTMNFVVKGDRLTFKGMVEGVSFEINYKKRS